MQIRLVLLCLLFAGCQSPSGRAREGDRVSVRTLGTTATGETVHEYVLSAPNGVTVKLMSLGATIRELDVPDRNGVPADVTLGFDDVGGYESSDNQYFGSVVGRVANRIRAGRFRLDGQEYELAINNPPNTLHGGARGFDKRVWQGEEVRVRGGSGVRFRRTSPAGEEGYPGTLVAQVTYSLLDDGVLRMEYEAQTDAPTPVNLTNHVYFNLAGAGAPTVLDHVLTLGAARYTPVDETLIPTGVLAPVADTPLDFRSPQAIGLRIHALEGDATLGYDHNFVLDRSGDGLVRAARLEHLPSGRVLEVWTSEPGLQFYSGNFLFGQMGKAGRVYAKQSAVCLEAQHFPDSVNEPSFPSTVLRPGETYRETTEYRFLVR